MAITNSIWLGDRDNQGAREYGLNGTATGNTSAAGAQISELLDGTTNGKGTNYGATCCAGQNVVTSANADWSNQAALFNIGVEAAGIAYDTKTGHLFVSTLRSGGVINEYDLAGNLLNSYAVGLDIAGLAYEQATDTLWATKHFLAAAWISTSSARPAPSSSTTWSPAVSAIRCLAKWRSRPYRNRALWRCSALVHWRWFVVARRPNRLGATLSGIGVPRARRVPGHFGFHCRSRRQGRLLARLFPL